MSNENTIDNILSKLNASLANMDAALTVIEYSAGNNQPIPTLAKLTVKESCEDITEQCELITNLIGD